MIMRYFHSPALYSSSPSLCLLILLTLPSSLPATLPQPSHAFQVPLTIIPSQSSGTWDQGGPQDLRASFDPPLFNISGTVLLAVSLGPNRRPTQAQWVSSTIATSPASLSVSLFSPAFSGAVGNLTLSEPQLQLTGGSLQVDGHSGGFAFTPSLAHLLASSLSGPVLGNDVSGSNLDVSLPAPSTGVANGTLTLTSASYSLAVTVPVKVALRAMTEATGVDHNYIMLLGDSYLLLNLVIQAKGKPA